MAYNKHTGFTKLKIGGFSNGKSLGETPMIVFPHLECKSEGVGQDFGCEHEESHLMHDM